VTLPIEIRYHPAVKDLDLPLVDARMQKRIKTAIERRLMTAPHRYGEPLRKTLKGYWKLRIGDYRIVFKIMDSVIYILGIIHRKKAYEKIEKQL
jgi:mRNA interferase RelE/StbE